MGWFSSETVYSAGIAITHLVKELPENPLKVAILSAIRKDTSIVATVIDSRNKTMLSRTESFLKAVKATNLGLPIESLPSQLGEALPIITIRKNGVNTVDTGDSARITSTKKALNTLGVNLQSMSDAIATGPGTVDDVYIMFAFSVFSTSPGSNEYFFRLLEKLYDAGRNDLFWKVDDGLVHPSVFNYQYHVNYNMIFDTEFHMLISYLTIEKETFDWVLGPVGTITKNFYMDSDNVNTAREFHNTDKIIIAKQISATQYVAYTIYGLETEHRILTPTAPISVYHNVTLGLLTNASNTFILPMFTFIANEMNPFTQEQFLADSLILYVHGIDSYKIAWYQSSTFSFLLTATIFLVTFYFGVAGAIPANSLLVAAVKAGALSITLSYLQEILAPLVGEVAAALILAVVAFAAYNYSSVSTQGLGGLPWAEELLKASLVAVDSLGDMLNKETGSLTDELTKDITNFSKGASDFSKGLETTIDLLGYTDSKLRFSNIQSVLDFSETPDEFYTRTIHQGNIGVIGIDAVSSYTANKLRLPKELPA